MKQFFTFFTLVFLFALSSPSQAKEAILSYHSDIVVRTDGALEITETIRVKAEGKRIKRGIYRDFPTHYRDRLGNNINAGFNVLSVERDDQYEDYTVEDNADGKRVLIGSEWSYLSPGNYTYEIRYETTWQLSHFEQVDELYFNAIGTNWDFPIHEATARVTLPDGATINRVTAYMGRKGSREASYQSEIQTPDTAFFRVSRPLKSREGLTIVVEWPKGHVRRPTAEEKTARFLSDNRLILLGLLGSLALLLLFVAIWLFVGRDPKAGVIIAEYAPPEGISPALARHIMEMTTDYTSYAAAVVSMAAKGYLTIAQQKETTTLIRTDESVTLSKGEKALADALFWRTRKATIGGGYSERAEKSFKKFRKTMYAGEGHFLLRNHIYYWLAITAAFPLTALSFPGDQKHNLLFFGVVGLAFAIVMTAVRFFIGTSRKAPSANKARVFVKAIGKFLVYGYFLFVGANVLTKTAGIELIGTNYVFIIVNTVICRTFISVIQAPTLAGRKTMDRIEGFKLYLTVAEQKRLDFHNPPELTPKLFDAYLPYAIALGVETEWGKQFRARMRRMEQATMHAESSDGRVRRSRSSQYKSLDLRNFSVKLSESLSEAIALSSTQPSSSSRSGSSGFSSSGSSGGGGGGGGGGGW